MSQRKMLQFSMGALLLVLTWFVGLVTGEISDNFSQCLDFFYNKTPPTGISGAEYQPICQRYKNQYRFASLYHRQHRAPLYSAYILRSADGERPEEIWKYEPQLVSEENESPNMQPFPDVEPIDNNVIESQAVPRDYMDSGYAKGHLNPSNHQETMEDREATFTLTNVVPQQAGSNSGPWKQLEEQVLKRFRTFCKGSMYVITGVIPYESETHKINNRVSVPEYMWSAYCCPSYNKKVPKDMKSFFPTYAAVGRNDPKSGEEIVPINVKASPSMMGYDVRRMSLNNLEDILAQRLAMPISLFHGGCQQQG